MSTPNLSDLPDEILENIFKKLEDYLGRKSIKNLTKVCRRFNDIISRNPNLTKVLTVYWNGEHKNDIDVLLTSKRQYQNISIKNVNKIDGNLMKFLKKNAIADVTLENSFITMQELIKLLKVIAKNVKNIEFNTLELSETDEDEIEDSVEFPLLEKLRLYWIECENISPVFILFKGTTSIRDFSYNDKRKLDEDEALQLSRMLTSFAGLKKLKLETYEPYFYNDDVFVSNAKFALKKYSHGSSDGDFGDEDFEPMDYEPHFEDECSHFLNFWNSQQASLESLNICRFPITSEIIDSILAMDKLNNLSLFKCAFRTSKTTSVTNTSIKNLQIGHFTNYDEEYRGGDLDRDTEVGYTAILSNCINVKDMNLYDFDITSGLSMCISIFMKNLEKITFVSNPRIFPMTYPSVKEMNFTVDRFMNYDDVLKLIRANKQLKFLHLSGGIRQHPNYASTIQSLNLEKLVIFSF